MSTINDDSSSSEDEILKDALKEATDEQFLKDSYFSTNKSENFNISEQTDEYNKTVKNKDAANLISLRKSLEQKDQFSNFGVSASFQNYVANKLDKILEKSIQIKKKKTDHVINEKKDKNNSSGIKLFKFSTEFLTIEKNEEVTPKCQKKRKIEATTDDKNNLLKCKEAAVDPEWVLSKVETKAWTNKRKEPEFKYKRLKNGTLVETT